MISVISYVLKLFFICFIWQAEPETCEHPNVASDFDGKIIKSDDPLLESNQINIDIKDNVKEDFCDIEKNDEHNSGGHKRECEIERQGENMVMRKDEMKEDIENAEMKYKQIISERRRYWRHDESMEKTLFDRFMTEAGITFHFWACSSDLEIIPLFWKISLKQVPKSLKHWSSCGVFS